MADHNCANGCTNGVGCGLAGVAESWHPLQAFMQVEYYLVSAARRSYRLRPGRVYVFGRETTVDIPLQDALASRRHAELRWKQVEQEEGWEIVDLNSRNGVLVNGTRTKESKLTDS